MHVSSPNLLEKRIGDVAPTSSGFCRKASSRGFAAASSCCGERSLIFAG